MKTFYLDGIKGSIDQFGFISWATIGCHIDSLSECGLKSAARLAK